MNHEPTHSTAQIESPLATLEVEASASGLRRLSFLSEGVPASTTSFPSPILESTAVALGEYFRGNRRSFNLPLDLVGATPFQRQIYELLMKIPYGGVTTYGALAREAGLGPEAARAVGGAVGSNPIPVIIPCHRVIREDHRLGGFSGGLERKVALLALEGIDTGGPHPNSHVHPEMLRLPL